MDGSKEALEAIKAGSIFKADAALRIRDIGHAVVDVPRRIILDEARGKTAQVNLPVKLITKSSSELDAYLADFS
jgi:ABC-type sugar transport system substrate-binding protein